ncbi:hypothetical protein TB2_037219 [Malus domestica]
MTKETKPNKYLPKAQTNGNKKHIDSLSHKARAAKTQNPFNCIHPPANPCNGFSLLAIRQQSFLIIHLIGRQVRRPKIFHFRLPSASGCVGMHSVTTTTPQRDGGGEADVIAEHYIEELPSALIGYSLPHPSRPLIKHFAFFSSCESLFLLLPLY